jgi:hypothetical protein
MTCLTSDNSLKYRLCVALYRVSFHTLSIGFKWGLYGGRKNSRMDFLCLYSYISGVVPSGIIKNKDNFIPGLIPFDKAFEE